MASNASFGKETGALEVAKTFSSQAKGKTILITGVSTGGIGDALAQAFAHGGASTVIITGRSDTKLDAAMKSLSAAYPSTTFRPLKLDLNSLQAAADAAKKILDDAAISEIDIIVANAGFNTVVAPREVTTDNIESHFGGNHLAHFVFITRLIPKLRAAAKKNIAGATRVVMMSSAATFISPIRFSDWNFEGKPLADDEKTDRTMLDMMGFEYTDKFEPTVAYAQSKTANILFALELSKRLASEGIFSFATHPGLVSSAGANASLSKLSKEQIDGFAKFAVVKTIDVGSATSMVAALDPKLTPESGVYLDDCQIANAPAWATDASSAERLWKLSEEIIGQKGVS
ncbi:retinol dehydrogenase 12 [Polyplosphaeria fusca]|uniref:Retinol dehydrogenase 12 n=1 Tax=Polyplosphaeria fusca TaxID=682080 RepID=A0A9P4V2B5_9PLEO|nr:retinol dehydrogenase 12 [Polyplosphaeria fusca]